MPWPYIHAVLDENDELLFTGSPEKVKAWLLEHAEIKTSWRYRSYVIVSEAQESMAINDYLKKE